MALVGEAFPDEVFVGETSEGEDLVILDDLVWGQSTDGGLPARRVFDESLEMILEFVCQPSVNIQVANAIANQAF